MKEIGTKLSSQDLHKEFNKVFAFMGVPEITPVNLKVKNNNFFHRYRVLLS